jgi:hypothetical protein
MLADIPVNNEKLPGQESRASENFTLVQPANGKARIIWHIEGATPEAPRHAAIFSGLRGLRRTGAGRGAKVRRGF